VQHLRTAAISGRVGDAVKASTGPDFRRGRQSAGAGTAAAAGAYIEASGGACAFDRSSCVSTRAARSRCTVLALAGQGHETSYAQIVSSVLGGPMESSACGRHPACAWSARDRGSPRPGPGSVMQCRQSSRGKGLALASKELERPARTSSSAEALTDQGHDAPLRCSRSRRVRRNSERARRENEGKFGVTSDGWHVAEVEIEPENGIAESCASPRWTTRQHINHSRGMTMQGGITQGWAGIRRACGVRSHPGSTHRELHGLPDAARRSHERLAIRGSVPTERTARPKA